MPTVEGRWANLMFSQRNNPYCELLSILVLQRKLLFSLYANFEQKKHKK